MSLILVEVAVIDEIQMVKDPQRGWAWTRAFLGLNAEEVHICGEEATVELMRALAETTGDSFEVWNLVLLYNCFIKTGTK